MSAFVHSRPAYRPKAAAELMGVAISTLWRLVASGEITTIKVQGTTWIKAEQIDAFFDRDSKAA